MIGIVLLLALQATEGTLKHCCLGILEHVVELELVHCCLGELEHLGTLTVWHSLRVLTTGTVMHFSWGID